RRRASSSPTRIFPPSLADAVLLMGTPQNECGALWRSHSGRQVRALLTDFSLAANRQAATALPHGRVQLLYTAALFAQARPACLDRRWKPTWTSTHAAPKNWASARNRWPPPSPCWTRAPPCPSSPATARK